ncbi:RNA polymerase sigma factor [Indiicoccus explosivorum]|uniref:RNA polymerase sigma factor n=1 Tax=Indiicoccus explosivorum TaxID=1917864 RepID=UPI000B43B96D|nr:sigma-70 family RNA polymerase sigma factor [Indiicoccus explosivorum]
MGGSQMERQLAGRLERIKSVLTKMGASREDAEDIAQDTAYKFILYVEAIDPEKAESWLFRVAVNGYYNLYRKRVRRDEIVRFNFRRLYDDHTPEGEVLIREQNSRIREVLDGLRPKFQDLLLLKYSFELSVREIAELYGMKEDSVKTTLYRARQAFISQYRRDSDD